MKAKLTISYTTTVTATVVVQVPEHFDSKAAESIGKMLFDKNMVPRKVWNHDDGEHEYLRTRVCYNVNDKEDYTVKQEIIPSDDFKPLLTNQF